MWNIVILYENNILHMCTIIIKKGNKKKNKQVFNENGVVQLNIIFTCDS